MLQNLPQHPPETPWPTRDWPLGKYPSETVAARVRSLLDKAFDEVGDSELGETQAAVIVHRGRLIDERYAGSSDAATTFPSWSKAKSITHALVGLIVGDGKLDVQAPAPVAEWAGDARAAITLDQLLRMSSGLEFVEVYAPGGRSDVIEMLFGRGRDDTAGFAASFPLAHPPGTFFAYSSGTSNIVSRCAAQALGTFGQDFERFMRERLFGPLGMSSPVPKFDAAGTFIGSSFCFATARDFARFGLLYLRGGVWEGRRLLPAGWVDYARTPTFRQAECPDGPYGAHWWLDMAGPGSFSANGFEGQYTVLVPDLDLIVVRHGRTSLERKDGPPAWIAAIAAVFRDG